MPCLNLAKAVQPKQRKTDLLSIKGFYYLFAKPVGYCAQYRLLIYCREQLCLFYS